MESFMSTITIKVGMAGYEDPYAQRKFFEEYVKWKARRLGIRFKPMDTYKMEGGCCICGRYELVFPLAGRITLCEKCFRNSLVAKDVYGEGVRWARMRALNILIKSECDACGRRIKFGENYYIVFEGRLCTKCCWKRLGKHHCVLSIDGERMW